MATWNLRSDKRHRVIAAAINVALMKKEKEREGGEYRNIRGRDLKEDVEYVFLPHTHGNLES